MRWKTALHLQTITYSGDDTVYSFVPNPLSLPTLGPNMRYFPLRSAQDLLKWLPWSSCRRPSRTCPLWGAACSWGRRTGWPSPPPQKASRLAPTALMQLKDLIWNQKWQLRKKNYLWIFPRIIVKFWNSSNRLFRDMGENDSWSWTSYVRLPLTKLWHRGIFTAQRNCKLLSSTTFLYLFMRIHE